MGSRFVGKDTSVLHISQGDTLTVRRRLNSGEQRAAYARMYIAGVDGELKVNPLATGISLILAYLLDWTITDDSGSVYPIRGASVEEMTAALDALDPESYAEIRQASEQHDTQQATERAAEKNARDGAKTSPAISPSPSDAAGAMSGSPS